MNKKIIMLFIILYQPFDLFSYELNFNYINAIPVEKSGGKETFKKPDGTFIFRYGDREEAFLRDKTRIVKYNNGKREIYASDGVKILIDYDNSAKYIYPDGKEKLISMDGKTPYGADIQDMKEVLRRTNSVVEIVYSSMLSDDTVTPQMGRFFRELVKLAQKRAANDNSGLKNLKIVISNCRFSITGYCRRKNRKEILITSYRNEVRDREFSMEYDDLLKKDEYIKLARNTIDEIFKN